MGKRLPSSVDICNTRGVACALPFFEKEYVLFLKVVGPGVSQVTVHFTVLWCEA